MTTPASSAPPVVQDTTGAQPPAIRLTGVTKTFGSNTVVQPVELTIGDNEFFSILGPSGCGKTTLMRMIAGFETPTGGSIELAGRSVESLPTRKRDLNMLFQSYALFPHLSVRDNIGFELKVRGRKRFPDRESAVDAALALVHMERFADRKPSELSGGQRQRVALARAVVSRPAVVLLDEPLGALDQQLRKEMQVELKRMQREVGITFVYVTHDQEEALTMSDRIAVMSEGRVQQVDAPREIYDRPANRFVAGFIGTCNLFDAVYHGTPAGATVEVAGLGTVAAAPGAAGPGANVTVAVRPERVELRPGGVDGRSPAHPATLLDAVFLGDEWRYIVRADQGRELVVTRPSRREDDALTRLLPGDPVTVSWQPDDARVLAA
ncbi:spermidine/putrescine ABC transporter ATP-binding protein [Leifsonia xyli]|uniref:ABC transporter ATP-binding protein n=1 Tax=Leifsonia xyli TaxID=1575 RepID=UPI0007CE0378|nr:spermidine/putrescine ABC transporter ATP-binding protein [Leifsonia xyli]